MKYLIFLYILVGETNHFIMKKALPLLLFLFVSVLGNAQNNYQQHILKTEKEIGKHIQENLSSFKIPAKELAQIKKNANLENQSLTEDELQKSLTAYKKYLLRVDFFNHFPF